MCHATPEQQYCLQLSPPEIKDTPEAPKAATERLQKMGPMSRDEKIMLGTMGFAVVLWVLGDAVGVSSVTAAMLGEPGAVAKQFSTWACSLMMHSDQAGLQNLPLSQQWTVTAHCKPAFAALCTLLCILPCMPGAC